MQILNNNNTAFIHQYYEDKLQEQNDPIAVIN